MEAIADSEKRAPWLSAHAGIMMMWIAVIHNVVGVMIFFAPLIDIAQAGVLDTVKPPHIERGLAAWFLLSGCLMFMLGGLMHWAYKHTHTLPHSLGWMSIGFGLLGVILMPASGFWLLIPVCIGIFQAPIAKRGRAAAT